MPPLFYCSVWQIRGSDPYLTKQRDKCFQVSLPCCLSVWFTAICKARGRNKMNYLRFTGNFIDSGSYVTINSVRHEIFVMCWSIRFGVVWMTTHGGSNDGGKNLVRTCQARSEESSSTCYSGLKMSPLPLYNPAPFDPIWTSRAQVSAPWCVISCAFWLILAKSGANNSVLILLTYEKIWDFND